MRAAGCKGAGLVAVAVAQLAGAERYVEVQAAGQYLLPCLSCAHDVPVGMLLGGPGGEADCAFMEVDQPVLGARGADRWGSPQPRRPRQPGVPSGWIAVPRASRTPTRSRSPRS